MKLNRENDHTILVEGLPIPAKIYVNEKLDLERSALEELEQFAQCEGIQHLSFSPDFHKGAGVPIGTNTLIDRVYPMLPGRDIGCGMRLDILAARHINTDSTDLQSRLRHAFFEGGREVFSNKQEILAYGLQSLPCGRTLSYRPTYQWAHQNGVLGQGEVSSVLDSYVKLPDRDNFLGSIGGGNHFVEIQQIDEIIDHRLAMLHRFKQGYYTVMSHSGSLDLGHQVGTYFADLAKKTWTGKKPVNGLYPLTDKEHVKDYIKAAYNAANFASVNRLTLNCMVAQVLDTALHSLYDAPHNLVWETTNGYLHRKGSCPAEDGELVIIPGSMGTRSLLALGLGFSGTQSSAPHGAGRILSRGQARISETDLAEINLVSKIDFKQARSDIKRELIKDLAEEAPRSYKDIVEVADTVVKAGIAQPIAWLKPLLTLKG